MTSDAPLSDEENSCILMRQLYSWLTPLITRCMDAVEAGRSITINDMPSLHSEETVRSAYEESFLPLWKEEMANPSNPARGPSITVALWRTFHRDVLFSAILKVFADAAVIGSPLLLQVQIKWVTNYATTSDPGSYGSDVMWQGYMLSVALAALAVVSSYLQNASIHCMARAFSQMRMCVMLALFDKAVALPSSHAYSGRVMQMHSTDAGQFIEAAPYIPTLFTALAMIVGATIALYFFIGPAAFIGLLCAMIMVPMQTTAGRLNGAHRALASRQGDKRIQRVNEFVQGIRIIKFMSWEAQFETHTDEARQREVDHFSAMHGYRAAMVSILSFGPQAMAFATFACAYAFGTDINSANVFPAFAMLNVLRTPITSLAFAVSRAIELSVSLERINGFLSVETQRVYVSRHALDPNSDVAIHVPHVSIQYSYEKAANSSFGTPLIAPPKVAEDAAAVDPTLTTATLMDIKDLVVPKAQLTIVIGATASGKSALINAIVGENQVDAESQVSIFGTVAYVAQEAWIMNETLKNNILMGKEYDEQKYKEAVLSCQLKSDFEQLPGSDATEIGERGINLSGGQKQRVAFARAVYSNRDIVLMDDPLSAVDPHVCGALFHGCIRGALAGKTRVLVTHQQQFLRWADRVILVAGLKIVFNGTYAELLTRHDLRDHVGAELFTPTADEVDDPSVHLDKDSVSKAAAVYAVPQPQSTKSSNNAATTLMSTEQVETNKGSIYLWYNSMAGAHNVAMLFLLYVSWRVASGFCDYMITWWATRAKPFVRYSMSQDQYLYWYAIVLCITFLFVVIRAVPYVRSSVQASRNIHGAAVHRLLHAPTAFYDTTPAGRIVNRLGKDIETTDVGIPDGLSIIYNQSLILMGIVVVQAIAAWFLPLVYLLLVILFYFLFKAYLVANHDVKTLDAVMRSPVLSVMGETLSGLATLRAYDMVPNFRAKHAQRLENMGRTTYAARSLQRWLSIRTDVLAALLIASVGIVAIGIMQNSSVSDRKTSLPSISLALTYVVMVAPTISLVMTGLASLVASFSSVERVKEYIETLPQERVLEYSNNVALTAPRPPENWPAYGSVEFDHVFLRYRPGLDLVLTDVSFSVKSGEKVGVVGRTGSGKSTIMLSLFRMIETAHDTHPVANRILIDGIDISHVKLEDVRTKVTIIPQDPLLFQGTVRSNLDPFNGHADDEIWAVLEKAKMRERVEREDLGLECSVADRGANFSAGERQLLCLARALLKNCKILLLDEATASIDPKHDQIVQDTIRREFADRTVLTIAHRLGTIIDSDKVLVLDAGRVLEFGYPHELLQKEGGQFRSMVHELGPEEEHRLRDVAKHAYDKSIERAKHHSAPY